jgi:hypothetical protein
MRAALAGFALSALAQAGVAQDFGIIRDEPLPPLTFERGELRPFEETDIESANETAATAALGAVLRGLDKVSGDVSDMTLMAGESVRFGRIDVTLGACRYPTGNPSGDAFAQVTVRAEGVDEPVFAGWMIASSPALSALDHPRYDVWVMRCTSS